MTMGLWTRYLKLWDRWVPWYSYEPPEERPEYGTCARCEAEIIFEVKECPECGNRPAKDSWRSAMITFFVGVILLIIFAPLGALVVFIAGVWALGSKRLKPVDHSF